MTEVNLMLGDCLDKLKELEDNSVDSIVTDPPYGLSFMGKAWDKSVPSQEVWEECLRVLKPGGYLLAFAGTRTQHRMAVHIEDAGFEIRDMIAWVYGSGFPKSMNISKAIDKAAGATREVIGKREHPTLKDKSKLDRQSQTQYHANNTIKDEWDVTAPATEEAKQWDGWGTALKPALEPITVARKPLEEKTVAANVLKYGTGAINIDASRISTNPDNASSTSSEQGRFPANLIHDGSEEVTELFPNTKAGGSVSGKEPSRTGDENANCYGEYDRVAWVSYNDNGSAARFFYCAKTSKKDRNEGVENNNHPTVKPTDLMCYLVRMVTPKGGTVLDPFMGSGSTGKAAKIEGFNFIGVELGPEYFEIAKARIAAVEKETTLDGFFE